MASRGDSGKDSDLFHIAFSHIDEDESGEITVEELEKYAIKNNYKPEFTKKWINLFDVDESGTITYEEYCNTLGLIPSKKIMDQIKEKCKSHIHHHTDEEAVCFTPKETKDTVEKPHDHGEKKIEMSGTHEFRHEEKSHQKHHPHKEQHVHFEQIDEPKSEEKMEAFITLASTDDYALGALVWASSLRIVGTTKRVVVMITRTISDSMRGILETVFDEVIMVDVLDSRDVMNLDLLTRPDLGVTFTKFHCWRLTQFSKGVFMDADTMVVQNVDDLFNYEEFSAAPDPGWPDCFNSGVFVFRPSLDTYSRLLTFAVNERSFDGGDQGLLNLFFSDWGTKDIKNHLPFVYNCVSQAFYSYLPAMKHFHDKVKVVHFIGPVKPWHHVPDVRTGKVTPKSGTGFLAEFLQKWWDIFFSHVKKHLTLDMEGLAAQLCKLNISAHTEGASGLDMDVSERDRQYMWERGEIDYTGRDRFDHIMSKIQSTIDTPAAPVEETKTKGPAPSASSTAHQKSAGSASAKKQHKK